MGLIGLPLPKNFKPYNIKWEKYTPEARKEIRKLVTANKNKLASKNSSQVGTLKTCSKKLLIENKSLALKAKKSENSESQVEALRICVGGLKEANSVLEKKVKEQALQIFHSGSRAAEIVLTYFHSPNFL